MQDLGQRPHLITQHRRLLEFQGLGRGLHAALNISHDFLGLAIQKSRCTLRIGSVVLGRNLIDTGGRAATNLMKQTRSGTICINRILTRAQAKNLLQDLNGFAHCPRTRVGTKKLSFFLSRTAVIRNPGGNMPREHQIWV